MTKVATPTTINPDANASVTSVNELALKDATGIVLEARMRVEHVRTGQRGTILRLDKRSRRAVITFDEIEGQPTPNDTMRAAHLLKVRKHAGRVLMAKAAVKAAKTAK